MSIRRPFNLKGWIADNRDLLKPPIGNKNLYVDAGDYIVMAVGGPNARKDYHWNETEELFYQIEGDIEVGIQEDGKAVTIPIREGEMFLLPSRIPHQPRRGAGTVGLVRPGSAEAFVAALEVGLLERKRIDVAVLQQIAASFRQRSAAVAASASPELPLSGSWPPPELLVKEDTEDLFG